MEILISFFVILIVFLVILIVSLVILIASYVILIDFLIVSSVILIVFLVILIVFLLILNLFFAILIVPLENSFSLWPYHPKEPEGFEMIRPAGFGSGSFGFVMDLVGFEIDSVDFGFLH